MESTVVQSADERRGYSRGYNRAGARYHTRMERVIGIARLYQAKLLGLISDAEAKRTCATCHRWNRGDGLNNAESCKWGTCSTDFVFGLEPRMWIDFPLHHPRTHGAKITTSEDFGCVNWLPWEPTAPVDQ